MCNGWGAPGNRTIGSGKIGSSRGIANSIPERQKLDAQAHSGKQQRGARTACPDPINCSPLCVCASSLCLSSGCSPKPFQCLAIRRFTELLERPFSYLSDSLSRHSHQRPDLLERHRLAAFLEAVIEIEDLALARGQVLLKDAVDELAHQLAVGLLLDLTALLAGEPLAQRGRVLVGAVDRRVERELGGGHAARG